MFDDKGGTDLCDISFETDGSFNHKDLEDMDVLKNVLHVVREEVDKKKYKKLIIEPKVDTGDKNPNVRFKLIKKLLQVHFKDYTITKESTNNTVVDFISLERI
jgi:uncharacterized protein (DUF111 family)